MNNTDNQNDKKGKGILITIGITAMVVATTICIAVAVSLLLDWYTSSPPAQVFAEDATPPSLFYPPSMPEISTTPIPMPELPATPEPIQEPEPTPIPEAIQEPEPTTTPEPIQEPEPTTTPGAIQEPEPTVTPEPIQEAEPTATPEPIQEAEPTTMLEPTVSPNLTPPQTDLPFSYFAFYIPENAARYAQFAINRPDLDTETIVWMVNVYLDYPFFERIQTNYAPNPIFISPAFRLPPEFTPPQLVPVNDENCILRATPETVTAFRALRATAQAAGFNLSATSAYRPVTRQAELWERQNFRDGAVARPYHSEHQTGRAIDLWGPGGLLDSQGPSPTGLWVADNAHYYGFIIRYRAETTHITGYIFEPWHITYVGVEISRYMFDNNILSLEEYIGRTFVR